MFPRCTERIFAERNLFAVNGVRYRGIFLNDRGPVPHIMGSTTRSRPSVEA
jgi:hypothetical protein